ncbi:MAG: thioredoxin family protein [Chloroflexota bacterium]|nr:MAG: thioredoxin family protein [Chloroflexota bacterium]
MMIEVCGPGCPRCHQTKENVIKALKELGLKEEEDALVGEVKDPKMISARGVMFTPAVIIDGVKVCEGRIPEAKEVFGWLQERK